MTIYRRKLRVEKDGGSYFLTFHPRDDLSLDDEAKWLVLEYCLYEDGKLYELGIRLKPARNAQEYPWYWRRGMRRPKRKQKIKDPWLSGE